MDDDWSLTMESMSDGESDTMNEREREIGEMKDERMLRWE